MGSSVLVLALFMPLIYKLLNLSLHKKTEIGCQITTSTYFKLSLSTFWYFLKYSLLSAGRRWNVQSNGICCTLKWTFWKKKPLLYKCCHVPGGAYQTKPSTQHRTRQTPVCGHTLREVLVSPGWERATDKTHRIWSFIFLSKAVKFIFFPFSSVAWVGRAMALPCPFPDRATELILLVWKLIVGRELGRSGGGAVKCMGWLWVHVPPSRHPTSLAQESGCCLEWTAVWKMTLRPMVPLTQTIAAWVQVDFIVLIDNNSSRGDKVLHCLFYWATFCQCSSAAGLLFSFLACDHFKSQFNCIQLAGKSIWISTEFSFVLLAHVWVSVLQLLVNAIWARWSIGIGTYKALGNCWAAPAFWKLWCLVWHLCIFVQNLADRSEIFLQS